MRQYSLYAADCVLARPLAEPLSLGFDAGISPGHRQTPMHFAASQLRGGLVPTPTGLSPASQVQLRWTHNPRQSVSIRPKMYKPVHLRHRPHLEPQYRQAVERAVAKRR